jgi:outer membrane biosynthesis protein TonB
MRAPLVTLLLASLPACAGAASSPSPAETPAAPSASATPSAAPPHGRLPPAVIQRIVRQDHGRLRQCYEASLASNPTLRGLVRVKFVIDRTGAVALAQSSGSTMPDATVVECALREFRSLKFPPPEGEAAVAVIYPIVFKPGDEADAGTN